MNRHAEKDSEAGGEGLGILATRKRLWRNADGNIVNARRPHQREGGKRRQTANRATNNTRAHFEQHGSESVDNDIRVSSQENSSPNLDNAGQHEQHCAILSDTPLVLGPFDDSGLEAVDMLDKSQSDWDPMESLVHLHNGMTDQFDFLSNASWGTQPFQVFMGAIDDLPYDDIFKPDTGMSCV